MASKSTGLGRRPLPGYGYTKVTVDSVEQAKLAWDVVPDPPQVARRVAVDPAEEAATDAYMAAIKAVFAPRRRVRTIVTGYTEILAIVSPWDRLGRCADCGKSPTHHPEGHDAPLCLACTYRRSLLPPIPAKPAPMPPEEIARIRAERLADEAIRRWRGDDVSWDRAQPVFLTVPHRQGDGLVVAKMVGKLDLVNVAMIRELQKDRDRIARKEEPTGAWRDMADGEVEPVFFHAHSSSQHHHKLDCPAPLDSVVADFLYRSGIGWVFCYERREGADGRREPGVLRFAPSYRFRNSPLAPEAEYDERWRVYLRDDHWERVIGVNEYKRHGDVKLHVGKDRELILDSPFIPQDQMIVLRRGRRNR